MFLFLYYLCMLSIGTYGNVPPLAAPSAQDKQKEEKEESFENVRKS